MTGPPRHTPRARTRDIDAETRLGSIYMGSLLGAQLRLALRILAALALTIGVLPLVFHLAPGLARVHLFGMPLSLVLLGALAYPLMVLLGWMYVRRAERIERDFADLMGEQ